MKKYFCTFFLLLFVLLRARYSGATCTADGTFTTSGLITCSNDPASNSEWLLSNPTGGLIMITLSLDSDGGFSDSNILIYSDDNLIFYFSGQDGIPYYQITFTSYTSEVSFSLLAVDSAAMNITYMMIENPCTTSMNVVWNLPNPSFEISCQNSSTAAIHSTWSITNYGIMKYQILSGNSSSFGFYDGLSKNSTYIYTTTTISKYAYTTGSYLFVTYDNAVSGAQNFDISINYIDLFSSSNTIEYWNTQGSLHFLGSNNSFISYINFYGIVATPSVVPPISEGQILQFTINLLNQYQNQSVNIIAGDAFYKPINNNSTTFTLPFSETDYISVRITSNVVNPSFEFTVTWQVLPQSFNPCLSSTTLSLPQFSGWIGCRSLNYNIIPSVPPHTGNWLIQSPQDTFIILEVNLFSLGYDSIIFYDGATTSSPILENIMLNGTDNVYFSSIYSSGNRVLVQYKQSSLTDSVLWESWFSYESLLSPCSNNEVNSPRSAETGRIECTSVSPNINSVWVVDPSNGPISISIDSANLVPNETIQIIDQVSSTLLFTIDSTFNKPGANINFAYSSLVFLLTTPNFDYKRSNPGSFQISYATTGSFCEYNSTTFLETTSGYITCGHIRPDVFSTLWILPHNGLISLNIYFELTQGSVAIYDTKGKLYVNTSKGNFGVQSLTDGLVIYFTSGNQDSSVTGDFVQIQYITLGAICGSSSTEVLSSINGVFGCPDGTNDGVDSYWTITPNNGQIVMKFVSADLEVGFDYVEIWDGSDSSGTYLGSYSSIPSNNTIIAYSGSAYVHLHTDESTTSGGFEIVYTTGTIEACFTSSQIQLSDPFGSFGCPNGLAAGVNSIWYITVPESDGVIEARFTEFSLTSSLCVQYPNSVAVCYDGNDIPEVIVSDSNEMWFYILTTQVEPGGFYIEYTSVQFDPCKLDRNVTLTANSNSFGCVTGISENVTSGWLIAPDDNNFITLSFSEFNLDSDSHIYVYNSNTISPSTLLGTFTGTTLPSVLVSTGPFMFVYLDAGVENATQRFRATYTTNNGDPCSSSLEETILTSSGTFGCQHGVHPSVHSSWLVAPQSNNILEVTIEYATLCSQCRLTIYDGSSTSADVLFRGNQTANTVVYTTHSVALITVDTIPNSNSNGFLIYFVTAIPPTPSPNVILPSATSSPIPEGFSRSASPGPVSATQSPFSQTPVFRSRTASVSRTNFPQASQQVSTRTSTPEPASESPSASMSTTPEPVFPSTTASHSKAPQFTIVPFSPSNFPTSVATIIPSRRVRDMYSLNIEFTCKTSATTCCNNFQTLWVDLSTTNYYDLVDVNSCVETSSGVIDVSLNQYGSQFFSAEQILDDYWKKANCNGKPLTGDICNVSAKGLSTSLWDINSMVVDGIAGIPSPLPYYYYEEVIYIGGSSVVTISLGLFTFILVFFI